MKARTKTQRTGMAPVIALVVLSKRIWKMRHGKIRFRAGIQSLFFFLISMSILIPRVIFAEQVASGESCKEISRALIREAAQYSHLFLGIKVKYFKQSPPNTTLSLHRLRSMKNNFIQKVHLSPGVKEQPAGSLQRPSPPFRSLWKISTSEQLEITFAHLNGPLFICTMSIIF